MRIRTIIYDAMKTTFKVFLFISFLSLFFSVLSANPFMRIFDTRSKKHIENNDRAIEYNEKPNYTPKENKEGFEIESNSSNVTSEFASEPYTFYT